MSSLSEKYNLARDDYRKMIGCDDCRFACGRKVALFGDCTHPLGWQPSIGGPHCKNQRKRTEDEKTAEEIVTEFGDLSGIW